MENEHIVPCYIRGCKICEGGNMEKDREALIFELRTKWKLEPMEAQDVSLIIMERERTIRERIDWLEKNAEESQSYRSCMCSKYAEKIKDIERRLWEIAKVSLDFINDNDRCLSVAIDTLKRVANIAEGK